MSQISSTQSERLVEFNKLLPELKIFLRHILDNEALTDSSKGDCSRFIERLENITKPPSLPPRSGRSSTTTAVADIQDEPLNSFYISKNEVENTDILNSAVVSQEYLEQQRELSRKSRKTDGKPTLPPKPQIKNTQPSEDALQKSTDVTSLDDRSQSESGDSLYERIGSVSSDDKVKLLDEMSTQKHCNSINQASSEPPPVPKRAGAKRKSSANGIKVVDLQNPLYSGLLRNVGSNTKQWCVIKHQKLYLFNDLQEPVAFIADLTTYEVIKDPSEMYVFRVTQHGEPSIVLAAVDEGQYELWHDAFKRAKLLKEENKNQNNEREEYLSLSEFGDGEEPDGPYEIPEDYMCDKDRARSPEEIYVAMHDCINTPRLLSPPKYETMENIRSLLGKNDENSESYSSMPLPPLPVQEDSEAPPLPARRKHVPQPQTDMDNDDSYGSSCESFDVRSDTDVSKSTEKLNGSENYTLPKDSSKGKEEVFNDLSAAYSGILYHRRMLAVWQKRYCTVKDQTLLCYRSPEGSEPSQYISLPGYKLDIAEEAWKSYAFKLFKEGSDGGVYYFAAINLNEQMRWLSVLAKEINKERFQSTSKLDSDRKSQLSQDTDIHASSEDSFDSNDSGDSAPPAPIDVSDSDFGDADCESLEGEEKKKVRSQSKALKNKHLHPAKRGKKNRPRAESFEDLDAEQQGYLYRKYKNHWSKRWCAIKYKKLLSYKNSPQERPDCSILLEFAALTTPFASDEVTSGYFFFKLRYEGDQCVVYRTKHEEAWEKWVACIQKYVGSMSEEVFPYINVPPSTPDKPRGDAINVEDPEYQSIPSDFSSPLSSLPIAVSPSRSLSRNSMPLTPTKFDMTFQPRRNRAPVWSEAEIEDSYINGKLWELQICNQSFRHIERFVLITKEKWLKVYEAINSTTPILSFNALDIDVKEENGADAQVLHLLLGNIGVELLMKAADKHECNIWKNAFEKIHYEDIDDDETQIHRPRSRSIEKKDPGSLPHGMYSRTLPNLGKRKKAAKEHKEALSKTRNIANTASESPSNHRKKGGSAISSLIRSFTIDTLGRKAKNKSYELPKDPLREEDIVLKETQHGVIKQVIEKDNDDVYEEKFCRIRGKVFQCYSQETDTKPLFKVPLKNAAIQDFANPGTALFRFVITALDTGVEYTFALDSEHELDTWTAALFGDDQLHKSLENSPLPPRRISTTFYTPTSPLSKRTSTASTRTSVGSKDSFVEDDDDTHDDLRKPSSTEPFFFIDKLDVQDKNIDIVPELEEEDECDDVVIKNGVRTCTDGGVETKDFDVSNNDGKKAPVKKKLKPVTDEAVKQSQVMFEISRSDMMSRTKTKRWVLLRKTVIEIYNSEHDIYPIRILPLLNSELIEIEAASGKDKLKITLKCEEDDSELNLIAPDENVRKIWVDEIKRLCRNLKRRKNPRHSVGNIMRRLGSAERMKELKAKKDKRMSMLLVDDDVKAIEKFKETADPAKMISGILYEILDTNKSASEKGRHCWIKNGVFHIAKLSKPDKPIRTIDLSTVVILDESDPVNQKHAFRLDFTKESGANGFISFRATDEESADKWMVSVSMGILFHRLSTPQTRESNDDYNDTKDQRDFEFVSLSQEPVEKTSKCSTPSGAEIRKENEKKLNEDDKENLQLINKLLENTPLNIPPDTNKQEPINGEALDGDDETSLLLTPAHEPIEKQLSQLNDEEDHVFNDQQNESDCKLTNDNIPENEFGKNQNNLSHGRKDEEKNEVEELENIPEKENADQSFKNVKGILRQQESIRRSILNTQRKKKTPPPVKPKPKLSTGTARISQLVSQNSVVRKFGSLESLPLTQLHSYQEQLEGEKTAILKCTKSMNQVVQEAKQNLNKGKTPGENSLSGAEFKIVSSDLERLQGQLLVVEKELRDIQTHITRKVALKGIGVCSPPLLRSGCSSPDATGRLRSGSHPSEPSLLLRESRERQELHDDVDDDVGDVDSIII